MDESTVQMIIFNFNSVSEFSRVVVPLNHLHLIHGGQLTWGSLTLSIVLHYKKGRIAVVSSMLHTHTRGIARWVLCYIPIQRGLLWWVIWYTPIQVRLIRWVLCYQPTQGGLLWWVFIFNLTLEMIYRPYCNRFWHENVDIGVGIEG